MNAWKVCLFLCLFGFQTSLARWGYAQSDADAALFFEDQVRPLLIKRCLECHDDSAESPGGNLRLTSRTAWSQGGDLGPAIIPHEVDKSLLIQAVRYGDEHLKMPPDGKIPREEIAILERWVREGAFDPRTANAPAVAKPKWDLESASHHWAFVPPHRAAPPQPSPTFSMNPIDDFVAEQWSVMGLTGSPPADPATRLRRVTFGLTGLPPSAADLAAFCADPSPVAYRRTVDRLLASPEYGTRWGRFWLDVARYADSNGMDENVAHGNAWRYRNYVIDAMNDDLSYDQFVREQIAGDLLAAQTSSQRHTEQTIATGFLVLGPKVLAEVDETKMELDIVDEQIETSGRAFLGLTLGCARCHDHKFDPIRIDDYYALAGIFKSTRAMETFKKVAKWHEVDIGSDVEHELHRQATERVKAATAEIATTVSAANAKLQERLGPGQPLPKDPETQYDEPTKQVLADLRAKEAALKAAVPEIPFAMAVADNPSPQNTQVLVRGNHLLPGPEVERGLPLVFVSKSAAADRFQISQPESGRKQFADWIASEQNPLTARVLVNRLWRWHFGRGLVESTDNFGLLGDEPTHPQLLDWLATEFMRNDWSLKHLHRLIVLSATYQMSSDFQPANVAVDPDNLYLWRANIKRLEAETIRDSMLSVSGQLDRQIPRHSPLGVKNRDYIFNHTSQDATTYDTHYRSVFLPVIRNHLYDLFHVFDYNDASVPNSNRATTTVPSQALFMLNSPLVMDCAAKVVTSLEPQSSDSEQLTQLFLRILGRSPTESEVASCLATLARFRKGIHDLPPGTQQTEPVPPQSLGHSGNQQAWQLIAQALLASNEFIFLR